MVVGGGNENGAIDASELFNSANEKWEEITQSLPNTFRSGILTEIDFVPTIIGGVKCQFDLTAGRVRLFFKIL